VTPVATGLYRPWSLAFPGAHTLLVTERNGKLRMVRDGVLQPDAVWTSPTSAGAGADSLHFVALHPQFAQHQLVYVSYPKKDGDRTTLAVARGRLTGSKLNEVKEIFVADAWETGGNLAGRIYFGPDGMLSVTVGDRDRLCCTGTEDNSLRMKAQALNNHVGKALRLRDDGTAPPDNPFVGKAGAKPEIFTYGHRNGYGLAVNPETGDLWQAEIGPMGGDEVNILHPGHNYGWPLVSTGRNYSGSLVSDQPWARPGIIRGFIGCPRSALRASCFTGDKFPKWKNSLFVGSLTEQKLIRISFRQPSQAEPREKLAPAALEPDPRCGAGSGWVYLRGYGEIASRRYGRWNRIADRAGGPGRKCAQITGSKRSVKPLDSLQAGSHCKCYSKPIHSPPKASLSARGPGATKVPFASGGEFQLPPCGRVQTAFQRCRSSTLRRRNGQLAVIALHFPGAGIADRQDNSVARPVFVLRPVDLREDQLAAQHINKLVGIGGPFAVVGGRGRAFKDGHVKFLAREKRCYAHVQCARDEDVLVSIRRDRGQADAGNLVAIERGRGYPVIGKRGSRGEDGGREQNGADGEFVHGIPP